MDQEILNSYSRINHLNVSRETFLDFENYISMILEKNKKINIISHKTASKKAIIERHITLDRTMWGTDQMCSVEPQGLIKLVRGIKELNKALGDGKKIVTETEKPIREKLRK